MHARPFGPFGVDVPIVGLGTWKMDTDDYESCVRAIRRAIERGMVHIDTAEIYGRGAVEELVGEAITGHRGEVFLASKLNPEHATYTGTLLACEKSLRRLRTDRLDLYMLHWRGAQPLEETLRALQVLRKEGKILSFGVSNFDVADLELAIDILGDGELACNQVLYHLGERDAEHVLQVFCERHQIAFVGYSPLGSGAFPRPGSWRGDVLAGIAEQYGVSAASVALAFLARRPNTFVIPKTSRPERIPELAAGAELALSPATIAALDAAFPLGPPKSRLPSG